MTVGMIFVESDINIGGSRAEMDVQISRCLQCYCCLVMFLQSDGVCVVLLVIMNQQVFESVDASLRALNKEPGRWWNFAWRKVSIYSYVETWE